MIDDIKQEIRKELARRKALDFIKYTWDNKRKPYKVGYHTKVICSQIDKAIENYRNGISTFIIVSIAFRHGKTEIVGRKLPVFFLSLFPHEEVIYVTHTAEAAQEVSKDSRYIIEHNEKYRELFPDIKTAHDSRNMISWRLDNNIGKSQYFGFQTGIAGRGGTLTIIDDFFKTRKAADSPVEQKSVIDEFTSGIMTRRPDPSIVFLIGTRWNQNDLIAFCIEEMKNNPKFPLKPENIITMPGVSDEYPSGYLFPERFSPSWYEEQKATLVSEYNYASLMQCDPILKGGNLLKVENVDKINLEEVPNGRKMIAIDLASSTETIKNRDPDYTVCLYGMLIYVNGVEHMYIIDMLRIRKTAPERNRAIIRFIRKYQCQVYVEAIAGYKDTYETLKDILQGVRVVNKVTSDIMAKDKNARAEPLEPIFDAGNIHIVKASWNAEYLHEVGAWDSGAHDDIIDCKSIIYHVQKRKPYVRDENYIY